MTISWYFCSMWDKLGWLNWFWQFLCDGLSSLNPKGFYYSYAWFYSLCEWRTSFCTELISRKPWGFLLMFSTGHSMQKIWTLTSIDNPLWPSPLFHVLSKPLLFWQYGPTEILDKPKSKPIWQSFFFIFRRLTTLHALFINKYNVAMDPRY